MCWSWLLNVLICMDMYIYDMNVLICMDMYIYMIWMCWYVWICIYMIWMCWYDIQWRIQWQAAANCAKAALQSFGSATVILAHSVRTQWRAAADCAKAVPQSFGSATVVFTHSVASMMQDFWGIFVVFGVDIWTISTAENCDELSY